MKKILSVIAISFSALMACSLTTAAPHHEDDRGYNESRNTQGKNRREVRESSDQDERVEKRRMREERGVQRLQQLQWQEGYVVPQHYRSTRYKIDFKENNLPRPARNEQWYKINNSYILMDTDSNTILNIAN